LTESQEKAPKISTMNQQRDASTAQLDLKEPQDLLANPVSVECEDQKDLQDSQEETVTQDHPENKDQLDPPEMMASQVNRETKELTLRNQSAERVAEVHQEPKEKKAQLETKELTAALEKLDPQGQKDHQALLVALVQTARRVLREVWEVRDRTRSTASAQLEENKTEVDLAVEALDQREAVQEETEVVLVIMVLLLQVLALKPVDIVAVSSKF